MASLKYYLTEGLLFDILSQIVGTLLAKTLDNMDTIGLFIENYNIKLGSVSP